MSNEERLRDALNWLVHLHHGVSKGGEETGPPSDDEWKQCLQEAKDALDATAGSPEMDRLVAWLQQDEGDYVSSEMQFTVIKVSRLLDHIREMESGPGRQ